MAKVEGLPQPLLMGVFVNDALLDGYGVGEEGAERVKVVDVGL
jgi:hypothetical protein